MEHVDILIIGGGAAGIAAAKECMGFKVLLADRKPSLGGVLLQCTHRGFGNHRSGIQYAAELLTDFPENITLAMDTTVLSVSSEKTALLCGREFGRREISFSQLILATGCAEIPAGALPIAGSRPKGVYTAGQMQEMMNLHGILPEGPVVILGSGDLGLIMAKQLSQAGLAVTMVEKSAHCGGIPSNQRCLKDYPIRLICSDTIVQIHGQKNICGCTTKEGEYLPCKTLLIAVGLRPERELIEHLGEPDWLHLCGNCSCVHPVVESVTEEGQLAGLAAIKNLRGTL